MVFRVWRSSLHQLLVWGIHQKLVENTTGTDDQREILYQIVFCSSIKKGVKQEESRYSELGICLSKQPLHVMPCFPRNGVNICLLMGTSKLIPLLLHAPSSLHMKLSLSQPIFNFTCLILFPSHEG